MHPISPEEGGVPGNSDFEWYIRIHPLIKAYGLGHIAASSPSTPLLSAFVPLPSGSGMGHLSCQPFYYLLSIYFPWEWSIAASPLYYGRASSNRGVGQQRLPQ